jgi:hypothetical protein
MFGWFKKKPAVVSAPPVPSSTDAASFLGHWVRLTLMDRAVLGFVYFDPGAGLSARGWLGARSGPPNVTVRLPDPAAQVVALASAEVESLGLPAVPDWLGVYGPQPSAQAPWRSDPHLRGRFHPSFPDDLEVLVHDGEPRRTQRQHEKCWVRVRSAEPGPQRVMIFNAQASSLTQEVFDQKYGSSSLLVFRGTLLNAPTQLSTIRQGEELLFISGEGLELPLRVTPQYLEERGSWRVQPCSTCGLGEGFDPPTVMAHTRFPDQQEHSVEMFTAFCPRGCQGQQLLFSKQAAEG